MAAMGAAAVGGAVSQPIPIHDAAREPSAVEPPLSPPPLTSAAQDGGADGGLALSDPYGIPSRISDLTARTCESKSCMPDIHVRTCATQISQIASGATRRQLKKKMRRAAPSSAAPLWAVVAQARARGQASLLSRGWSCWMRRPPRRHPRPAHPMLSCCSPRRPPPRAGWKTSNR